VAQPTPAPRLPPLETYRGVVYPWHCDHMGHMNVMWYTGKFDEATWSLFSSIGVTAAYMREMGRGMVAVEQRVTYRRELLAGDLVTIRSWFLEAREKVLRFRHEMVNAETGEVAAECEFTAVHIDTAGRRSCALPDEVLRNARTRVPPPPGLPSPSVRSKPPRETRRKRRS
jgi:acyl-CoA thioester hydrolase